MLTSGTASLHWRRRLRTYVEYLSGLNLPNNKGLSSHFIFKLDVHAYSICAHTTAYLTKTIPKRVHYNCYCLSFSTNQSSIAVVHKKKKPSVSAIVYTHCLICSQNIHMPPGAKVLKGRYTDTSYSK